MFLKYIRIDKPMSLVSFSHDRYGLYPTGITLFSDIIIVINRHAMAIAMLPSRCPVFFLYDNGLIF